ncbi:MAG: DUF4382 domain-containing protein [Bacteroidetes bacterium]|nr:DUF4382 domain-containing protein [Bacteroidota bacterium]
MKNLMKKSAILFSLFSVLLLVGVSGCKKHNESQMTIRMTDAPGDFLAVHVDGVGLILIMENRDPMILDIKAGVYNLLELQNNVSVILANKVNIPYGRISEVRLILGSNNSVITPTGTYEMKVPSGSESGLKIKINQDVISSFDLDLLIDFDADASVNLEGNGSYSLKPVIKLKSVRYI